MTASLISDMVRLHETNDVARLLGQSEAMIRRLVRKGVLKPTADTRRGTVLFDDDDIERARKALERPQ
jgi:DNA-binding transcriptional MerR regulator